MKCCQILMMNLTINTVFEGNSDYIKLIQVERMAPHCDESLQDIGRAPKNLCF